MMKCGHAANARKSGTSDPVCAICIGIDPGADQVAEAPNLSNRMAICTYRGGQRGVHGKVKSNTDLPFFELRDKEEFDLYYCGCHGWD